MKEEIIFSLHRDGKATFRLIARDDGTFEEWQPGFSATFDRHQIVAMAESILAWNKNNPDDRS